MTADEKIYPVILSGGAGTRLWPVSRAAYPKQLQPLLGENTMIQEAALRVADPAQFQAPTIICSDAHRFVIAEQMRTAGIEPLDIVLEPMGRDSAPAITIAALIVAEKDPSGVIAVFPSDASIGDTEALAAKLRDAGTVARKHRALVVFGARPDRPDTAYGYIRLGELMSEAEDCYAVERFVEKPDLKTAEDYLADGRYLWNIGMFVLPVDRFLEEVERFEPEMLAVCRQTLARSQRDLSFTRLDGDTFATAPAKSLDYAVMERTDAAAVIPVDIDWSDIGSWDALWEIREKDENANATIGDVVLEDSKGCFIWAGSRLVAGQGLEDLIVVETDTALLVMPRAQAQKVKSLVDRLKAEDRPEAVEHGAVYRPWGYYRVFDAGQDFQVKHICVNPGATLSLQLHNHRAEHWVVVSGRAHVVRGDETLDLEPNQSIYIPLGMKHRLSNPGDEPLRVIEVQSGTYLGEDDIVRFDDDYGRAGPTGE